MKKALILIIIIINLTSCDTSIFSSKIKEGIIKYKLEYLDDENEKPIISLLPTEMTISFKKGYSLQEVEGWLGIFRIAAIRRIKENTKIALLKIMADKYMYSVSGNQETFGYNSMKDKKITFQNKTKEIAGYKCKKAVVKWHGSSFDIYYTDEIIIDDPNWNNPFKEIKGVLMEYQIEMFGIKTKISVESVNKQKLEDDIFDVPADYKKVSKEEMEEVINKLINVNETNT